MLGLAGFSDRYSKNGSLEERHFKEYIAEGLAVFSEGMSKEMGKKHLQFVNVQGGVDSDIGGLVDVTQAPINTPYEVAASAASFSKHLSTWVQNKGSESSYTFNSGTALLGLAF